MLGLIKPMSVLSKTISESSIFISFKLTYKMLVSILVNISVLIKHTNFNILELTY